MLTPSREHSHLLPQAPPFARRRGIRCSLANLRAHLRGRRDTTQPLDNNGLHSTTAAWHREADHIAAQIDDALRARLHLLDQEVVAAQGHIRDRENIIARLKDDMAHTMAAEHPEHSLAASESLRNSRATTAALDRERVALTADHHRLAQLAQTRNHLQRAARDIGNSWSARCDELTAHHRRGYNKRLHRTTVTAEPPVETLYLPRHRASYEWAMDQEVAIASQTI